MSANNQRQAAAHTNNNSSWMGDLGRSLFGFILGGSGNEQQNGGGGGGNTTAAGMTGTRQRPPSHTAQSLQVCKIRWRIIFGKGF